MTKLKVLSASTALVLGLTLASPTISLAQGRGRGAAAAGGHVAGGSAAAIGGGGGHMGSPGMAGRSANFGRMGGAPATAPALGSRGTGPNFAASAPTGRVARGTTAWGGDRDWHRRGWWPGAAFVAGAGLGSYAYSGGPDYYYDDYYDYGPDYGDIGVVAPAPVDIDSSYCAQRYRSYDPATGTYLGYDGQRHPCP